MRTQIIDDRTYVVGDDTLQVDDNLELDEAETTALAKIRDLNEERLTLQQNLINECLKTDRNYVPQMTADSVRIADVTLEMSYSMNILLTAIYKRVGGMLPLLFEDDYTKIKIRRKNPDEELNYTTKYIKNQVGFDRFEDVVAVMRALDPEKVAAPIFDISLNKEHKIQPLILTASIDGTKDVAEAVKAVIDKKSGIGGMVIMLNCAESLLESAPKDASESLFFMEDPRQPQRVNIMGDVAKKVKPEGVIVVRAGAQMQPTERIFNIWHYTKNEKGDGVKTCVPVTLNTQPRSVEIGATTVGKFEPGAQYEEFIN